MIIVDGSSRRIFGKTLGSRDMSLQRPIYYDPMFDAVSKSLEQISSTTVSEGTSSVLTPIPEKALAKKLRRRETKSTRTAQEITTESEATGSETTSEDNGRPDEVSHSPRHKSNVVTLLYALKCSSAECITFSLSVETTFFHFHGIFVPLVILPFRFL